MASKNIVLNSRSPPEIWARFPIQVESKDMEEGTRHRTHKTTLRAPKSCKMLTSRSHTGYSGRTRIPLSSRLKISDISMNHLSRQKRILSKMFFHFNSISIHWKDPGRARTYCWFLDLRLQMRWCLKPKWIVWYWKMMLGRWGDGKIMPM